MKKQTGITKTYLRKNVRFFVCKKGGSLDMDKVTRLRGEWEFLDSLEFPKKTVYIYTKWKAPKPLRNADFGHGTIGEAFASSMMFNGN
jgi:hypothetical protein